MEPLIGIESNYAINCDVNVRSSNSIRATSCLPASMNCFHELLPCTAQTLLTSPWSWDENSRCKTKLMYTYRTRSSSLQKGVERESERKRERNCYWYQPPLCRLLQSNLDRHRKNSASCHGRLFPFRLQIFWVDNIARPNRMLNGSARPHFGFMSFNPRSAKQGWSWTVRPWKNWETAQATHVPPAQKISTTTHTRLIMVVPGVGRGTCTVVYGGKKGFPN